MTADAGAVGGKVLRVAPVVPFNGVNSSLIASLVWSLLGQATDFEIAFFYRQGGDAGSGGRSNYPARLSKNLVSTDLHSYQGEHRFNGLVVVKRESAGSQSAGAGTDTDIASVAGAAVVANTWYGMRFKRIAGALTLKHWARTAAADFGESAAVSVGVTDGSPLAGGYVGVGGSMTTFNNGQFGPADTTDFDVVGVTTAPATESAPLANLPPDTPTIAVSAITTSGANLTGSAFSDPITGDTHAASQFRCVRVVGGAVDYDSGTVAASVGPHAASGLTSGVAYTGQIRYQDQRGAWSAWGASASFTTKAAPNAPVVTIDSVAGSGRSKRSVRFHGSAFVDPDGDAHVATQYRAIRVSTAAVLVGPTSVGALTGVFELDGLPRGPHGVAWIPTTDPDFAVQMRYQDADALWSAWGTSASFQTPSLWESGEFVTHVDVQIERPLGGGTIMQSYRSFGDPALNWIKSLRCVKASVDQPVGSGSVTLFRSVGDQNLAPLVIGSPLNMDGVDYVPALDFGREIVIRVCLLEKDAVPTEPDWITYFTGITDDPEWPRRDSVEITVPFRDQSGALVDMFVRTRTRFGTDAGVDAVVVLQQMVDAFMGAGQYTIVDLVPGTEPRYSVTEYEVENVSVWDAMLAVVLEWGGKSLRQVEDPTTGAVTLAVSMPPRDKTDPDYSVPPSNYIDVDAISTSGKNLRTIVKGRAIERATGMILEKQIPAEVDVETDPLVVKYGKRYMGFDEDAAKGVDTQPELDAMVAAIYADVSQPVFPFEIQSRFAPFALPDDLVEWLANGKLFDEDHAVAVLSCPADFTQPGVARSRWQTAGAPKGAWDRWRKRSVEVVGVGTRPSIFSAVPSQVGQAIHLVASFNRYVTKWEVYDNVGSTPIVAGAPLDGTLQAVLRPEVREFDWSVRDGDHYIAIRVFAGERIFAQLLLDPFTVVGVGGGGGGGSPPDDIPLTPDMNPGTVVGDTQEFDMEVFHTNPSLAVEVQYVINGVTQAVEGAQPAGTSMFSGVANIGDRVKGHARYTTGVVGEEGLWSSWSSTVRLSGML